LQESKDKERNKREERMGKVLEKKFENFNFVPKQFTKICKYCSFILNKIRRGGFIIKPYEQKKDFRENSSFV
jgi:hypothetical protein